MSTYTPLSLLTFISNAFNYIKNFINLKLVTPTD